MRRCNYNLHGSRDDGPPGGTGSKYYSWRNFSPGPLATDQVWSPGPGARNIHTPHMSRDNRPGYRKRTIKCPVLTSRSRLAPRRTRSSGCWRTRRPRGPGSCWSPRCNRSMRGTWRGPVTCRQQSSRNIYILHSTLNCVLLMSRTLKRENIVKLL